ncbi:hypothetical protein N177_3545 [Lutibaculum baratangense AMV1]|uniref:Uncharacterized protein n=1 Tax=Lutibaculum baratangense AMV1 TaxID=631454 RepID=V4QUR5_9HYPH|nr:hypothetical protein N177_3545 [Lutibaculum baratangense AMV1]
MLLRGRRKFSLRYRIWQDAASKAENGHFRGQGRGLRCRDPMYGGDLSLRLPRLRRKPAQRASVAGPPLPPAVHPSMNAILDPRVPSRLHPRGYGRHAVIHGGDRHRIARGRIVDVAGRDPSAMPRPNDVAPCRA